MAVYEGVYKSLLQGVSQQTPQERTDGQLAEQINMVSDPVTGLRRRSGTKLLHVSWLDPEGFLDIVKINGVPRLVHIDTSTGTLTVVPDIAQEQLTLDNVYQVTRAEFVTDGGKSALKTVTIGNEYYIANTELVPRVVPSSTANDKLDPSKHGYFSVRSTAFERYYTIVITYGSEYYSAGWTTGNTAAGASPESVAVGLVATLKANHPNIVDKLNFHRQGNTVAVEVINKSSTGVLEVTSTTGSTYMFTSGLSRVTSKTELLGTLPAALDNYVVGVGTEKNSAYYKYGHSNRVWAEVGAYTPPTKYVDVPLVVDLSEDDAITVQPLDLKSRSAGDELNNPYPSFIDYGITGLGAYQSRLVILSGAFVCLSKTTDYTEFMRTTVEELLDDDAIEISSASLSSAQFEYAVPFNKDLVLIAQGQQAVIPANSTVLSPKTAVIYPSTTLEVSLAVKPVTASRTMYYVFQQGSDYYQVGEFIPNAYTEAQLYSQNLTDHIPLYAEGVCTSVAASTNNNMIVFCSGTTDLLVHQYMWVGDDRPLMAFHKWRFADQIKHVQFLDDYLVLFSKDSLGNLVISTANTQLNQLTTKPVPYLDNYVYVDIPSTGRVDVSSSPTWGVVSDTQAQAVIYDSTTARHSVVKYSLDLFAMVCPYVGRVAVGTPYESTFTLTPPFIRDNNGKVVTGTRTTLQSLKMTYKNTGTFNVEVADTMGQSYDDERTAYTWSEADLGYTWVNSVGSVNVPCRTRLSSTECTVSTSGTTDMNLITTEYIVRTAQKRRRM
ncbi:putative tail tubular protein B [Vibrio phage vB_VhaP_VH-5]|uniref:Putative tail tubular protein B n=1 Tax=Vibrio phage vB_VhaP_VH-5 TaxID=2660694 RepID=A0A5Q2W6E4_9CAUD|nr:putative tail tubular protein B [Vibrio phage vB_VhaP_VH-5]